MAKRSRGALLQLVKADRGGGTTLGEERTLRTLVPGDKKT